MSNLVLLRPGAAHTVVPPPQVGFYYANDRNKTGPPPNTVFTRYGSLQTDTTLSPVANNQVFDGIELFGLMDIKSFSGITIKNSRLWVPQKRGAGIGCVNATGGNFRGLTLDHCLLSGRQDLPGAVDTLGAFGPVGRPLSNEWASALRGGNYNMLNCEVTGLSDGLSFVGYAVGTASPTNPYKGDVFVDMSWIHNGWYAEWTHNDPYYPVGGSDNTHVDGVQFHRGSNYSINRTYFGGVKVWGARTPSTLTLGTADAINSGDDMFNSCFMVKQEVDGTATNHLTDVLIDSCVLEGCAYGINISVTAGRNNTFGGVTISNNRFKRATAGKVQYYIINSPTDVSIKSNNVMDDDGSPVPITRGA